MKNQVFIVAAALTAATLAAAPAFASTVTISGLWATGDNAPMTTEYSVPGESYSVSFSLPTSFAYVTSIGGQAVTTTVLAPTFSNFTYRLNGVSVPLTMGQDPTNCDGAQELCFVQFYPAGYPEGVNIVFGDHSIELIGQDIGSTGTLINGNFYYYPNVDFTTDGNNIPINQGGTQTLVSVVPEPATWTMMLLGLACAGGAARLRRREPVHA